MKNLSLILLTLFLVTSCKKIAFNDAYNESYRKFLKFKKQTDNTYSYTQKYSDWDGYSQTTVLKIRKGKVAERAFESYQFRAEEKKLLESWVEKEITLNTHESGAPARTLDEVYALAKSEWLKVDKKHNTIYFETKNNGLISTCGYVPKPPLIDGGLNGIKISEIKPLNNLTVYQ